MKIERQAAALGARVNGIDLAEPLDPGTASEIESAFLAHQVLVFPEQQLDPDSLVRVAELFGPPQVHPLVPHIDGHPGVLEIRNFGKARTLNEHWHTDVSFEERPPRATLLYALEIPEVGGDTQFASQIRAYEALSDGMRALLDGLRAEHSGLGLAKAMGRPPEDAPRAIHPVVRTHAKTGARALYACRAFTHRFENMTHAESAPLLEFLFEHATRPEFTMRHAWTAGDLVVWDNAVVQHYAIHDHGDAPRVLHRVTVEGEQPR